MRLGITSKLFLAILLASVATAIVVAVAAQLALKSGFRNYVTAREERRLSTLADALVDAWREHGDWHFLRANDNVWREFNRPGPPRARRDDRPPPPPPPERDRRSGATREPPAATLFDADRQRVVGNHAAASAAARALDSRCAVASSKHTTAISSRKVRRSADCGSPSCCPFATPGLQHE